MNRIDKKITVDSSSAGAASDILASGTGLPKGRVKDAMNKGAVWIRKKGRKLRLRRASSLLRPGDLLEIHYDEKLLSHRPPQARLLWDQRHYSVWDKPSGLMSQGTEYGDHCSLMRQVELFFGQRREVYLVHRLDREVPGVMLIAHTREAAAKLSELFRKNLVEKRYRAEVLGNLSNKGRGGVIELPLDGRPAHTEYKVAYYDVLKDTTQIDVLITTGRLHQIRRHFDMIGHPVMGDPRYGRGNKNAGGIRLEAVSLKFVCPFSGKEMTFESAGLPSGASAKDAVSLPPALRKGAD